jgi:hypothetical protein
MEIHLSLLGQWRSDLAGVEQVLFIKPTSWLPVLLITILNYEIGYG